MQTQQKLYSLPIRQGTHNRPFDISVSEPFLPFVSTQKNSPPLLASRLKYPKISLKCCRLAFLAVVLCFSLKALAQSQLPMFAPLFNFEYDPAATHFDPAPPLIRQLCPFLHKYRTHLTLYASWKDSEAEYFVVNGYIPANDESSTWTDDSGGTTVAIRKTKCTIDNADWTFSGQINPTERKNLPEMFPEPLPGYKAPLVPAICNPDCHYTFRSRYEETILNGLLSDALARFAKAFGGKDKFLAALNQRIHDRSLLDPIVRERLEEYEKQ